MKINVDISIYIYIYIYTCISYCVGYRAIWQVIARVCEVLPEPKARVILTHECNNSRNKLFCV